MWLTPMRSRAYARVMRCADPEKDLGSKQVQAWPLVLEFLVDIDSIQIDTIEACC
jgi:hypothetical protein